MNANELKDWTRFTGELKRNWREFTDDDLQQVQGNYDKFVSKVQQRYGKKKDELMRWIEGRRQRSYKRRAF